MEIRFDPLNEREAEAVAKFLNRDSDVVKLKMPAIDVAMIEEAARSIRPTIGDKLAEFIKREDRPDVGVTAPINFEHTGAVTREMIDAQLAQRDTPLPPGDAPLPAAADLFATAPAAPQDGEASATIVPSPPAVPAPPTVAPPAPAVQTPRAENGDLDKSGLPWDARIHSGSREKNKDGTWRQRRNLADGMYEQVEAELRAVMALPVPATVPAPPVSAAPLPPPAPVAPTAEATALFSNTTADAPATVSPATAPAGPTTPPVPAPPASDIPLPPTASASTHAVPVPAPGSTGATIPAMTATAPANAGEAPTFSKVMAKVASNVTSGKLTMQQVHAALEHVGLQPNQINMLATRSDLLAPMMAQLDHYLAGGA